jgi:hypothetical protein
MLRCINVERSISDFELITSDGTQSKACIFIANSVHVV